MRLPDNIPVRGLVMAGLAATLAGCSLFGGGGDASVRAERPAVALPENGPQADFPMVLGEAFTVDGQEFVPADTASYDAVGLALVEADAGQGITLAHRTLPLPSYVELTNLATGRTVLARVERRGPMTTAALVGLSPAASALLGGGEGTPVRVRRVNPPETDRAELRAGRKASERMDTPRSLLGVLQRKLPPGSRSVTAATAVPVAAAPQTPNPAEAPGKTGSEPPVAARYALRPLDAAEEPPRAAASPAATGPETAAPAKPPAAGDYVIQAAAFSSKANAERAARAIGGFVTEAGRLYRVRTGPFATRGQAEAALAKVRAAGYSDARVLTAG